MSSHSPLVWVGNQSRPTTSIYLTWSIPLSFVSSLIIIIIVKNPVGTNVRESLLILLWVLKIFFYQRKNCGDNCELTKGNVVTWKEIPAGGEFHGKFERNWRKENLWVSRIAIFRHQRLFSKLAEIGCRWRDRNPRYRIGWKHEGMGRNFERLSRRKILEVTLILIEKRFRSCEKEVFEIEAK